MLGDINHYRLLTSIISFTQIVYCSVFSLAESFDKLSWPLHLEILRLPLAGIFLKGDQSQHQYPGTEYELPAEDYTAEVAKSKFKPKFSGSGASFI